MDFFSSYDIIHICYLNRVLGLKEMGWIGRKSIGGKYGVTNFNYYNIYGIHIF